VKPVHIKEQRQKEVRSILEERYEIWEKQRALGYRKLNTPIRHGWYKEIIIVQNVERYKNRNAILEIYAKVEKCFWGRTKEEAERKWLNETSKYLINKEIPTLSRRQFNKLSDAAQRMCIPFQYYTERKKLRLRFYVNIPKGAYRIKFSRAYITHSKRIDPYLESQDALIEQKLLKNGYFEADRKQYKWKDCWNFNSYKQEKLKMKRELKSLKKYAISAIINEEIAWERN